MKTAETKEQRRERHARCCERRMAARWAHLPDHERARYIPASAARRRNPGRQRNIHDGDRRLRLCDRAWWLLQALDGLADDQSIELTYPDYRGPDGLRLAGDDLRRIAWWRWPERVIRFRSEGERVFARRTA